MNNSTGLKLLFIINLGYANSATVFREVTQKYFSSLSHTVHLYDLPENSSPETIKEKIKETQPARVIAVGGDGTVKLVAKSLLQTHIPLGILPAGSSNGMAKELGITANAEDALDII